MNALTTRFPVIDAHAHLGEDCVYDVAETEEELVSWYDRTGVKGMVVQPYIPRPTLPDITSAHDRIHKLCLEAGTWRREGTRNLWIWGMASIHPHLPWALYEEEASRCVKELGFVALKLHPLAHGCNPKSRDGMHVLETATSLKIGVMVHTGTGIPFSDCLNVELPAKSYPSTPVILAHGGANFFTDAAIEMAKRCDNVFLETSWCGIHHIRKMIRILGAQKIIFASDHGDNLPVELEKYETLHLTDVEYEWCLYKTLQEALRLPQISD